MSTKIIVDETEPLVDVPDPPFRSGDVTIRIGKLAEEHYHILDFLGRGKFGEVKRCQEKRTGHEYAAKLIAVNTSQDRKDVINEIEIMKKLHHKRIIQLYDAFDDKNETCLILEIIHGGELFDRVISDDFVLSEKACVCLVRQICEGLEYMHSQNIIHLDMKPENVMCLSTHGNRIKIIDFGLAREYNPKKDMRVLFGTPEFMAPEVIQYEPIHYSTDMWSVGVICYVLLSGLSPFMGDSDGETLTNVIKGDFDFDYAEFDEVSDEALDLIERLLLKDKSKRLTAKQCLEHPWLRRSCSDTNMDLTKQRLRHYVYRRKWQKVVNAIIALKRMGVQLNTGGPPAPRGLVKMSLHRPVINVQRPMSTKDDTAGLSPSGQSGSNLNRFKSLPDVRQGVRNGFVVKTTPHGAVLRNKGKPVEKTIFEDTSSSKSPVVDKTHPALDFSKAGWKKTEPGTPDKTKLIWDSVSDDDAASSIADDLAVDLFIAESDDEKPPPKQVKSKKKDKDGGKLKSLITNFEYKDDDPDNPRRKCDSGYSEDSKSFTDSECQDNETQSEAQDKCFFEGHTIIPAQSEEFFKHNRERQSASQSNNNNKPVANTVDNASGNKGWLKKKDAAPGYHNYGTNPRSRWPPSPDHQGSTGTFASGLKWQASPGHYSPGAHPGNKWPTVGTKDSESHTLPRRKELSFPAANAAMDKLRTTNTISANTSRARFQENLMRNKKNSDSKKAKPTYYIKLPNGGAGVKALADLFNAKS